MSKMDARVVRDLSESKKRVMTNVVQHLQQRHEKKSAKRWPYGVLAVILSVCIGLFIYQQYNVQQQQASTIPPVLDERILELYLQLDSFMNGKNRLYKASFDNFLYFESTFAYAQSKKLEPTQEQVDKALEQFMQEWSYEDDTRPTYDKLLQMLQVTNEGFIENYGKPIAYKMATLDLLWEVSQADYKDVSNPIRTWLVEQAAMNYLEQHYHKDIASLREKYKIPEKDSQMKLIRSGTVLAIKEHEFLVVSGVLASEVGQKSVDELVQKHSNGTWFPLVDVPQTLSVGDRVEVQYRQSIGNDDTQPFLDYKDIVEMKIVKEFH
ncbi:DUF3221 domain-containing protein [Lysinibacillus capsici]|uniref:DUF3221 domain-containing protein n=1 Tax=Lysinibacillus capsici TaxID=2115968 RepID=UPI002A833AFB|nr:DUF3221 domain-containing protein [Lysinibacillus capsici]